MAIRKGWFELKSMIEYGPDSEGDKKNILIVDDHEVVRRGLTALLSQQPDLTVCHAVASAEEALEVIEHEPVDLAIVDISLGRMDGLTLTDMLRQRHPNIVVLILSMHDEHLYGRRALDAGASGFVAKQDAGETLLDAIYKVLAGQRYFRSIT
jgi:DNA-binding NarL/FixJ family response regulator